MIRLSNDFLSEFSPNEQLVMLHLLLNSNNDGFVEFNERRISRNTGIPYQQVRTIHKNFLKRNFINENTNAGGNAKSTQVTICSDDCYDISKRNINAERNAQLNAEVEHLRDEVEVLKKENKRLKEELTNVSNKKGASDNNTDNQDAEFIERMYKLYPTKCPKRNMSLGKSSKDKDRIAKLLKKYTKEQIEFVIKREIEEKFGKHYMQNFSTFLNNFPEPEITDANEYCPVVDGIFTTWDDEEKCVRLSNNNIEGFCDGYSEENRPDGATVKYGMYTWKWSSGKVKWVRQ